MLRTIPIALINTISELEPAEINGSGTPVGGMLPDMTCYCTKDYFTKLLSFV